jgi:hypothetical protein
MAAIIEPDIHVAVAKINKDVADFFRNSMIVGSLWALSFYVGDCGMLIDLLPRNSVKWILATGGVVVATLNVLWFTVEVDAYLFSRTEEAVGGWGNLARYSAFFVVLAVSLLFCFLVFLGTAQFGSKSCLP